MIRISVKTVVMPQAFDSALHALILGCNDENIEKVGVSLRYAKRRRFKPGGHHQFVRRTADSRNANDWAERDHCGFGSR